MQDKEEIEYIVTDEVDGKQNVYYPTENLFDLIFDIINCIFFGRVFTILITAYLMYDYWINGNYEHFYWTLGTYIVSSVCILIFYYLMYHQDHYDSLKNNRVGKCKLILQAVQSYFLTSFKSTYFYYKSYRCENEADKRKYALNAAELDADDGMTGIVGNFIGTGPQKILQVSIILHHISDFKDYYVQYVFAIFAIILLNWSLVSFHKKNRLSQSEKFNLNWLHVTFLFSFNILLIGVRVICIALLFSVEKKITFWICLGHILFWIFWLYCLEKPTFTNRYILLFDVVFGCIYLFTFIPVKEKPTRYRYSFYHMFNFLENTCLVYLFYLYTNEVQRNNIFFMPLVVGLTLSFLFGVSLKLIYYTCFHPHKTYSDSINEIDIPSNSVNPSQPDDLHQQPNT